MSDVTITKVSGPDTVRAVNASTGAVSCVCVRDIPDCTTITITNFQSLELNLESPAGDFPIPETEDFGNIIIKAEGNRFSINMSWTVVCNACVSITSDSCFGTVSTVAQQLDYWLNVFQPYSIEGKYLLKVDGIARIGYIRKSAFSKSEQTPVTYSATMDFIAGDVVASE